LDDPIHYHCINCGICCNRLLIERQGVHKGLPLLPTEIELFRRTHVRPAYGIGINPKDPGFRIVAYQMRLNRCPHRRLGGCFMHAYRPAICRSYPFVPVINQDHKVVKLLDMTCTTLKAHVNEYRDRVVPVDSSSVEVENAYYPIVAAITEQLLMHIDSAWFYNLKTGRWVPFRRLLNARPSQTWFTDSA
jgi:Fe-S-cluster containining protein